MWPPAGIGVGVLAVLGYRYVPAVLLGEVVALAMAGIPLGLAAMELVGNFGEAFVGAFLLRSVVAGRPWFTRVYDVVALLPIAVVAATISASFGVSGLYLTDLISGEEYGTSWVRWMLGDAASIIILVPAIAAVLGRSASLPRRSALETAGLAVALLTTSIVGLVVVDDRAYLVFPVLAWAALRFHQPGAAVAGAVVAGIAVAAASQGDGPFAAGTASEAINASQLFVVVAAVTSLVLAIVDVQRERASAQREEGRQLLQRSEALLAQTEQLAHAGGWEWDLETNRGVWSPEMYRIYGLDPAVFALSYRSALECIHPEDRGEVERVMTEARERGATWTLDHRIVRPGGEIRHIQGRGEAELGERGQVVRLFGFEQDVTDLVVAERERTKAERRHRRLVERLPAISYVAEAGPYGAWLFVSPQIEEVLGYTAEEWMADPSLWRRCVHPGDRDWVIETEQRGTDTGLPVAMEYRMVAKDGRQVWVKDDCIVRSEEGKSYLDGMLTEITERKAFESQLQYLADHDPLTGLFNRRRFLKELAQELKLLRRDGGPSSLVMLDLDNFKYVNDSLGHSAGDALIRSIADLLRGRLRAVDTLARLGGDEFAVLLRGADSETAIRVSQELLESIRARPRVVASEPVRITASAGLSELDIGVDDAEDMLAAADVAMYEAKRTGRDRLAMFSPELRQQVQSGQSWADRVRAALESDGFLLYQQPIIELGSRRICQHEILLRMRDERGEIVTPGAFLPIAERFDLIQSVDRWVIRHVIELMEDWLQRGTRIRLEVNLSGRSIGDAGLLDLIEELLEGSSVDPSDLIFEVTETAAIANMEYARAFSERLSALGCGFALDDFGSGFASFFYLKHLPVDLVKIDGDFVRGLTESVVDQQVVQAMIGVTRALGQKTVAEFVGDEATFDLLAELGVDYAQGYYVGEPRPVSELTIQGQPAAR